MGDRIREYVAEGIENGVKSIGEGAKDSFKFFIRSWQFGIVDLALFIALCVMVYYCYQIMICGKERREKAAGRLYFTVLIAFLLRVTLALLAKGA